MKRPFRIWLLVISYWLLVIFFGSPSPVLAVMPACYSNEAATIRCINEYVVNIVKLIVPAAAVVALLFLIFGGIKFIFSSGDPKKVDEAKKTLTYALFGLGIIFSVWMIFNLIYFFSGAKLWTFNVVRP